MHVFFIIIRWSIISYNAYMHMITWNLSINTDFYQFITFSNSERKKFQDLCSQVSSSLPSPSYDITMLFLHVLLCLKYCQTASLYGGSGSKPESAVRLYEQYFFSRFHSLYKNIINIEKYLREKNCRTTPREINWLKQQKRVLLSIFLMF